MDFATAMFMLMIEGFADECKPYACIGPNARPADTVEYTQEEIDANPYDNGCKDYTWRNNIQMSCEQAQIWDDQAKEEDK